MKQCPQCGSTYSDDTLNYCLTDRTSLVPVEVPDEETTVIRPQSAARETQVLAAEPGVSPVFKYLAIGFGIFLLLLAGAGLAAWSFWNSRSDQTAQQTLNVPTPEGGTAASRTPTNSNKETNRGESSTPVPSPSATRTAVADVSPTPAPKPPASDPGTGRISFKKGSTSQTMSGTLVHDRSFVLRTMAGQTLNARVSSRDGCVEFDGGGNSVGFTTPNGDVSLNLVNTCDEPAPFTMNVSVR